MKKIPQVFKVLARKCIDRLNRDGRLDDLSLQPVQLGGARIGISLLACIFLLSNWWPVYILGSLLFAAGFCFFSEIMEEMEYSLPSSHPVAAFGDSAVLFFLYVCLGFGQTIVVGGVWPLFFGMFVGILVAVLIQASNFLRRRLLDKDKDAQVPTWEVSGYKPSDLFYLMPLFALFLQLDTFLLLSLPVIGLCAAVLVLYYYKQDQQSAT